MSMVNADNSRHYKWGKNSEGWHLLESDELSVIEEIMPPGGQEQSHYHERAQQFFYVLSGVAEMQLSGELLEISQGSGLHVPAGVAHQIKNKGDTNLRFLVISQPKSHGDRFEHS